MSRPRLTVFTKTIDGARYLERVLPGYRDVADEVVVGIDSATQDESADVARKYADRVFSFPHGCAIGRGEKPRSMFYDHLFPECTGDWILQLDHDETLSAEWKDPAFLDELLSDRSVTHAFFPRRWALPGEMEYISSRHWEPDFQMRLFRNIPSLMRIHENLHDRNQVAGEGCYESRASIVHWNLVWESREERLERVRSYARRSSYSGHEYYLYERQAYEKRPLDERLPDWKFNAVFPAECHPRFRASIRVLRAPEWIFSGELGWVLIAIHNASDRLLRPDRSMVESFGFNITHHWLSGDGEVVVWDCARWPLPRRIGPGETALSWMWLRAPTEPGMYRAKMDLIEEGVSWFSAHVEMPTIPVEVKAWPDLRDWYPELASPMPAAKV